MRLLPAAIASAFAFTPSSASSEPQRMGPLWQSANGSVIVTECPSGGDHDAYCRAIAVKQYGKMVTLGGGYMTVKLLWAKQCNRDAPDLLIIGDSGGSGGDADLFAISFTPKMRVRKIGGERFDTVTVGKRPGALHLSVPFDIEYFNGAPHAGAIIVPLPLVWKHNDFAIDWAELTHRSFSVRDIAFRRLAVREELQRWADNRYPAPRLYPPDARGGTPVTVTALAEMMLSGHADQVRALLDQAWPRLREKNGQRLGGEADFWAALCQAVVQQPYWRRFKLFRLPHADIIEQGAHQAAAA